MQGGNNSALLGAVKAACRALAAVAVTGVTPEAWRLAKINDNDLRVKRIFWRALHDLVLLVLTKFSLPQPKEQLTHLYVQLLGNSVNDENVTSMVQYHLRLWKYPLTDFFYSSFEDCSSRDLALALGWLMSKEQIFKRYSDIAFFQSTPPELQSFPYDITELVPAHSQKQAEIVNGCAQVESLLSFSGDDKVKVRTDQMRYSLGKLEFELRDLLLTSDRYIAATHKLQLLQHYKQPNILTPYELHLIRSWRRAHHSQASNSRHPSTNQQPHLFQSHTEALLAYNQAFDSRVKLAEQEKVFWKWLSSLVDEKETDEILRREDNEPRLKLDVTVENIHESFTTNKLKCSNQFESPEQSKIFSQLSSKWQQMREAVSPATYNQLKQRFQPIANELSNHVPSLQPHPSSPSGATLIHGLNYFNVTESKYSGYSGIVPKNLEESRRDTGTHYQQHQQPNNTNTVLDNRISVVYSKKDSHSSQNTRTPHLSSQPTSAAIEAQRLLHLVNSFQQHLLLMHQKNSSLLMNLVQPKLDSQNLQLVVFK